MGRLLVIILLAAVIAAMHLSALHVLVAQGAVENKGEGGEAFDCLFLGTQGLVRIGYFYRPDAAASRSWPAPRTSCPWHCVVVMHTDTKYIKGRRYPRCAAEPGCPYDWCKDEPP